MSPRSSSDQRRAIRGKSTRGHKLPANRTPPVRKHATCQHSIVSPVGVVDDYFESLDADTRAAFERIRSLALDIVPDAEQGTSYGMAALRYKRKPLLGFAAAKRHLSVFPFSPQVVDEVRDRLSGYELSKGTIRFTVEKPLPDDVIRDVVTLRLAEISWTAR